MKFDIDRYIIKNHDTEDFNIPLKDEYKHHLTVCAHETKDISQYQNIIDWIELGKRIKNKPIEPIYHIGCAHVLDGDFGHIRLIDTMGCSLDIVNAARVSLNKFSEEWNAKDAKLLKFLILNGHTSPLEMAEFKFEVYCPLFIARQWFRHRTWSFNERSRRYTSEDIKFYIPKIYRKQSSKNLQASEGVWDAGSNHDIEHAIRAKTRDCFDTYNQLISMDVCREQARMILPQNMMTKFIAKVDGNNLMKFVILRQAEDAQAEIRQYADAIVFLTQRYIKEVWETLFKMLGIDFKPL